MQSKKQLFQMIEPSENLKNSIINKIKTEEIKKTMYKIAFGSVISLTSITIMIMSVINIFQDAYQSGLSGYISLLFSDGASVISFWQSYMMSIVESLPIIQITIVVASVWVFVWAMNTTVTGFKNRRSIFYKVN